MIRTADLRKSVIPDTSKPLTFQVVDIADNDAFPQISKEELEELMVEAHEEGTSFKTLRNQRFPRQYQMMLSGLDGQGVPVTLSVGGFHPFFYVQIPETDTEGRLTLQQLDVIRRCEIKGFKINRQEVSMDEFLLRIKNKAMRTFDDEEEEYDEKTEELIRQELEETTGGGRGGGGPINLLRGQLAGIIWPPKMELRKDLYWYKGEGVKERYYRLEFRTKVSFFAWRKMVLDPKNYAMTIIPSAETKRGPFRFNIYEANLEPSLRFIHAAGIPACGWVTVPAGSWDVRHIRDGGGDDSETESDAESIGETTIIHAECDDYKAVSPAKDQSASASLLIASFDIESDSSHGDFPLAKKRWERIISVLAQNPTLTPLAAATSLREAIKGRAADYSKTEPFGPIYFKRPVANPTSPEILEWMTPTLMEEVMKLAKKSPEEAQEVLLKRAPTSIGSVEGDPIIQIGTTFHRDGKTIAKHIITLGSCNPAGVPESEVVPVSREEDVIREWVDLIEMTNPDIITGYNITFFDMAYIRDRAEELGVLDLVETPKLARFPGTRSRYHMMRLSSAAMGDNFLKTIEMPGRVVLDLCAAVRRNFTNLDSYKLDNVAQAFLFGEIKSKTLLESGGEYVGEVEFTTKSTFGLTEGGFIHVCDEEGEDIGGKLPIVRLTPTSIVVSIPDKEDAVEITEQGARWTQAKDDVPPSEIFRLQKGTADDRSIVAKYCVQDCVLVLDLLQKLDIVPNAIAMGTVCSVPLSYIFFRGQTIKLSSLVYRECEHAGLIVPVLSSPTRKEMNDSYEGAVVLEPRVGLYLDCPVAVFDYGSLYPSSMIAENISHDTIVAIWDRDNTGKVVEVKGDPELAAELPEGTFVDITFDRFEPDLADTRKVPEKVKVGTRTCRYVQKNGIVGEILRMLLVKRKEAKKLMEAEKDPFKKALYNALQLAYKVTANSLYGALGAKNCKIRFQDLAASTTATGRKMLNYAREAIERLYGRGARPDCDAKYVYGDTDSVFVMFQPKYPDGTLMKGRDARVKSLELAKEAERVLSEPLRAPQTLNYEKIFDPFMLFSKKRYIGMKYEEDPDKCKQANMGVVLKRRDNAPIVKEIYQAVVDTIMKDRDLSKSVSVAREILRRLVAGKVSLKKLTITKSLRAEYANPDQIAHKVLAERIGDRDPGNKPKANDRIAFVYFDSTKTRETKKQGDRIETPEYMVAHNLRPDYTHYITNQIQKPLAQLFSLFWSQVEESSPSVKEAKLRMLRAQARQDPRNTPDKIDTMIERAIATDIEKVIFAPSIRSSINERVGPMDAFLKGMKIAPRKS